MSSHEQVWETEIFPQLHQQMKSQDFVAFHQKIYQVYINNYNLTPPELIDLVHWCICHEGEYLEKIFYANKPDSFPNITVGPWYSYASSMVYTADKTRQNAAATIRDFMEDPVAKNFSNDIGFEVMKILGRNASLLTQDGTGLSIVRNILEDPESQDKLRENDAPYAISDLITLGASRYRFTVGSIGLWRFVED